MNFVGDTGVFVVGEKFKKLVAEIDAYTHYFKSALRVYYNYLLWIELSILSSLPSSMLSVVVLILSFEWFFMPGGSKRRS